MYLTRMISKHFPLKKSRQKTMMGIINALLLNRGVQYKQMAEMVDSKAKLASKIKRIYRFLAEDNVSEEKFLNFMEGLLPEGKLILAIDRTNWQYGSVNRNIFTISLCLGGISMPIIFITLPHKGASCAADQIKLITKFINKFGKERIEAIIGDREFDSEDFIRYLHLNNIPFCIRIRKHNRIQGSNGKYVRIDKHLNKEIAKTLKTKLYNISINLSHIEIGNGKFLTVAASDNVVNPIKLYSLRWDIETAFKGCKTNGFRIEDSHITCQNRIENLIKCLFIAFAIAVKTGIIRHSIEPIKLKKTLKTKASSFLQYGLDFIKQAFSQSKTAFCKLFSLLKLKYPPPLSFVQ
jgi:Transposase DDE domain